MYLLALLACGPSDDAGKTDAAATDTASDTAEAGDSGGSGDSTDPGGDSGGDTAADYPGPTVTLLAPTEGAWVYDTENVPLEALATGGRTSTAELTCAWFTGGSLVVVTGVAEDGAVSTSGYLPASATTLQVCCTDALGREACDEVGLTVWPSADPIPFTLIGPGGTDGSDDITVDDDVAIYLAGGTLLSDTDGRADRIDPITVYAFPGDELRVKVVDQALTDAYVDALALVGPTGIVQPLSDAVCLSSSSASPCYDPSYTTILPNIFFDETFVILGP